MLTSGEAGNCVELRVEEVKSARSSHQDHEKGLDMDGVCKQVVTPLKAIRLKCLDCSAGQAQEVRLCPVTDCALYPYRFGRNPRRKGIGGTFEQKLARESGKREPVGVN